MSKDTYEDVAELQSKALGVLGGEGSEFLEKVTTSLTSQGIETKCTCGMCARQCKILVSYEEAVIGSLNLMPPQWQYDDKANAIYPNIGCTGCTYLVQLFFTPQELKRYVERAVRDGEVAPQTIQSYVAKYRQIPR